jgi:hypothetical protein
MWLVGGAYNFCWAHDSLRLAAPPAAARKWLERTPAMAAGLTDHRWTLRELLHYAAPRIRDSDRASAHRCNQHIPPCVSCQADARIRAQHSRAHAR